MRISAPGKPAAGATGAMPERFGQGQLQYACGKWSLGCVMIEFPHDFGCVWMRAAATGGKGPLFRIDRKTARKPGAGHPGTDQLRVDTAHLAIEIRHRKPCGDKAKVRSYFNEFSRRTQLTNPTVSAALRSPGLVRVTCMPETERFPDPGRGIAEVSGSTGKKPASAAQNRGRGRGKSGHLETGQREISGFSRLAPSSSGSILRRKASTCSLQRPV